MRRFGLLCCIFVVLAPGILQAQQPDQPATINLKIQDQSGAPIPLARVMVLPAPTPADQILITGQDGQLTIRLAPGHHILRARAQGFKLAKVDIEANAGEQKTIAVTLEVGTFSGALVRFEAPLPPGPPQAFPDRPSVASPDGRYILLQKGSSRRHVVEIEDTVLKARRRLLQYHQRVAFTWALEFQTPNQWTPAWLLATDYFDSQTSQCTLYSVENKTPPISVLELLNSQLEKDEMRGLEEVMKNKRVLIEGHPSWYQNGIVVAISAYGVSGALEFQWDYYINLPRSQTK